MHPHLEDYRAGSHTEFKTTHKTGVLSPPITDYLSTRQGSSSTKKIRAVCASCNNGWMNRLEGHVRPILLPLIEGRGAWLDVAQQATLARWIAMKTMVSEHAHLNDDVTPLADRIALRESGTVPSYYRVQIAKHDDWTWASSFYRHSATLSRGPTPETGGTRKNIQVVSFGIGALFVNVLASRAIDPDELFVHDASLFPRIFPEQTEVLDWPPDRGITADEMNLIATSLETMLKQRPGIKWRPMPDGTG